MTLYLMNLFDFLNIGIEFGFITFLLEDPNHYNLSKEKTGEVAGIANMWSEVFIIIEGIILGLFMDSVGRKIPLVGSFIVLTGVLIALPLFKNWYPYYIILRSLFGMAAILPANMPLTQDYISKKSLGLTTGYTHIIGMITSLLISNLLYRLIDVVSD